MCSLFILLLFYLSVSRSDHYWVTTDWKEILAVSSSVIRRLEVEKQERFAFLLEFRFQVPCKSSCLRLFL